MNKKHFPEFLAWFALGVVAIAAIFGIRATTHADTLMIEDRTTTWSAGSDFRGAGPGPMSPGAVAYHAQADFTISNVIVANNPDVSSNNHNGSGRIGAFVYAADGTPLASSTNTCYAEGGCTGAVFLFPASVRVPQDFMLGFVVEDGLQGNAGVNLSGVEVNSIDIPPSVINLDQLKADGVSVLSEGSTTTENTIVIHGTPQAIGAGTDPLRLEVEVQPFGTLFKNLATATSSPVAPGTSVSIMVNGLLASPYHWQARVVDVSTGAASVWQEFGTPKNFDFIVASPGGAAFNRLTFFDATNTSSALGMPNGGWSTTNWPYGVWSLGHPLVDGPLVPGSQIYFQTGFITNPGCLGPAVNIEASDENGNFLGSLFSDWPTRNGRPQKMRMPGSASSSATEVIDDANGYFFNKKYNYALEVLWADQPSCHPAILSDGVAKLYFIVTNFDPASPAPEPTSTSALPPPAPSSTPALVVRQPVVIVPGVMGTALNKAADNSEVWPNIAKMVGPGDAYLDDLALSSSGAQIAGKELVAGSVLKDISLLGVFKNTIYGNLIKLFTDKGYVEGKDLFVVPYDWRRSIASSTLDLSAAIDKARAATPDRTVTVVSHSMGALLTKYFFAKSPKPFQNDKLIFIGMPQLGAPEAFQVLNYGDDEGIPILNGGEMKKISQNMPSAYELLPSSRYVQLTGGYIKDFRSGKADILSYASSAALMTEVVGDSRNQTMLTAADALHASFDNVLLRGPNIYNISGCLNPTPTAFSLYDNGVVDIERGNGDGTVPIVSAFNSANRFTNYFVLGNKTGVDHMGLVSDSRPLALIGNIVDGTVNSSSLPEGVSQALSDCVGAQPQAPKKTMIEFSTHSPVALHVYDSTGHHTGPLKNGDHELGIPGGTYQTIGENSFATVPGGSSYKVMVQALAPGEFTLKVKTYTGGEVDGETAYIDVPLLSSSTKAELDVSVSTSIPLAPYLKLDRKGNGNFDTRIAPSTSSVSSDLAPPLITVSGIPTTTVEDTHAVLSFSASDIDSGVFSSSATFNGRRVANGDHIEFEKSGKNIIVVTAVDRAGNHSEKEIDISVLPKKDEDRGHHDNNHGDHGVNY